MDLFWSLDDIYKSFDSDEFKSDLDKFYKYIEDINKWSEENLTSYDKCKEKIEYIIVNYNDFFDLFMKLISYAQLTLSVDAKNKQALSFVEKLEKDVTQITSSKVKFEKYIGEIKDIETFINSSDLINEYSFYIKEIKDNYKYLLTDKEEMSIAKMKNTGSDSWTKLQELLTSTLLVDIEVENENKKLPLSVVRSMAYDKNENIRKNAYDAEIRSYKKIEESSAAALNSIKGEAITLCNLRGYDSVLQKTIIDSRLNENILNTLMDAIKESLPMFRKFYNKKAQILGHDKLPFYDLFASVGEFDKQYSYEEAREYIVGNFKTFSDELAQFADNAFENDWIDAKPREGKRGGAFCENIHAIKQSRILSNFTGNFNDVVTLAHELGHAYHDYCLKDEKYLNSTYPMPIAETASIFCETIVKKAAMKELEEDELITILENDISDNAQVIVDIYSRFLFESEMIKKREEGSLSVEELKQIMIEAQKNSYGDGLDQDYLHPYMWTCKPHYYYADENFYNFPYAFGLLFSKGLYNMYLKEKESFVDKYNELLSVTGRKNIKEIGEFIGIDLEDIEFWRGSLKVIEEDINKFMKI
ncbi:M3 family oligoendopeptidase [Tepidibacter hydrothermalis]|uniref:M3 family oligoendopeptidase n=1 Tax=Tepidibacter hydrothermalis TaxID=3036126 RepID=A0ABY8EAB1_9FIRM|nr:M3 family oligoendopeptidase [Tepidibacter hydrothermalis]WFD09862.1 M3 family oligoendopeptidase [Tepidibacter hydrothermalis]